MYLFQYTRKVCRSRCTLASTSSMTFLCSAATRLLSTGLASGVVLTLLSCSSPPRVGRFSRLEIVDKSGNVRATISVTDDETLFTLHGSRKPDGVKYKVSPTLEVSMGINTGSIKHSDESGTCFLDSRHIILSDPNGTPRIEIKKPVLGGDSNNDAPKITLRDRNGKIVSK